MGRLYQAAGASAASRGARQSEDPGGHCCSEPGAKTAVSGRCWATVWWERLGLGPFTEGPLGFSRRIYPGRRRERSLQEACLSFTGSASPTSGQGEPPAHGLTWVGGVTRRGFFCQGWAGVLEAQLRPLVTRGLLPCQPVLFYLNHFFHVMLLLGPLTLSGFVLGSARPSLASSGLSEVRLGCHL